MEEEIGKELMLQKSLIDDSTLPISSYNYSAVRDRLLKRGIKERGIKVALSTIIDRAKDWSPYAQEKWTLITSIDGFSRKLRFADFFPQETTWTHIQSTQALMQAYGIPLRY